MKIFVITAHVEIISKPIWLDDFRSKYDMPYDYHITLKQPCFVEENEVASVKETVSHVLRQQKTVGGSIPLTFNALHISQEAPEDICIMINTPEDLQLRELQRNLVQSLSQYSNYYKPKYKKYEQHFEPHITIGRNLNEASLKGAMEYLKQDYTCTGKVTEIKLIVVNDFGPGEASKPGNQTIFTL